jgi:hypothetical protein
VVRDRNTCAWSAVIARLSCTRAANAWANALDLGVQGLPVFDPEGLPPSSLPPMEPGTNTQDRPIFETELALIASLATSIRRITPSRAEAEPTPTDAIVLSAPDLPEALETKLPLDGRGRGLVLHRLIDEVLTGEAAPANWPLCVSAGWRCRRSWTHALVWFLNSQCKLHARFAGEGEEQVVSGIADAVALVPDGSIEVVVDWNSDVAPAAQTVDGYWGQVMPTSERRGHAAGYSF